MMRRPTTMFGSRCHQAYFETINWYRTALHKHGHAGGHCSRLNRDLSGSFGSKKYAFEELVAELNAAFCCASLGIVPTVRHADYIGSWLKVLREDKGGADRCRAFQVTTRWVVAEGSQDSVRRIRLSKERIEVRGRGKKAACGTGLQVSRRAIGGLAAVPTSFVTGQQISS